MQFNLCIDQVRTIEWGLSLSEASLFSFIFNAGTWANKLQIIDGLEFRFLSRNKLCSELPAITSKPDTMYRLLKSLHSKGVILFAKSGNRDMVHVTEKARIWGKAQEKICLNAEKNPSEPEKSPTIAPENNPTYQKTILNNNQLTKESEIYALEKFERLYDVIPNKIRREDALKSWKAKTRNQTFRRIDVLAEGVFWAVRENYHQWKECLADPQRKHFSKTLVKLIDSKPWEDARFDIRSAPDMAWAVQDPNVTLEEYQEDFRFQMWEKRRSTAVKAEAETLWEGAKNELEQPRNTFDLPGWPTQPQAV